MVNVHLSALAAPEIWPLPWDEVTAISTAVAAIATAVLAGFTLWAILEGQRQRRETNEHFEKSRGQSEQHHQDAYRPLLALFPMEGFDVAARNYLVTTRASDPFHFVDIACEVRNIGGGPAINVRLIFRASDQHGDVAGRELSPIGAGGVNEQTQAISIRVIYRDRYNKTDLQLAPNELWSLLLVYDDVFGNTFHTVHSKQTDLPWCQVGCGPPSEAPKPQPLSS